MTDSYGYMIAGGDARAVAETDFSELGTQAQLDGAAHVAGKTCAYCGETILPVQAARLVHESDWIHDGCRRPS